MSVFATPFERFLRARAERPLPPLPPHQSPPHSPVSPVDHGYPPTRSARRNPQAESGGVRPDVEDGTAQRDTTPSGVSDAAELGKKTAMVTVTKANDRVFVKGWPGKPTKLKEASLLAVLLALSDIILTLAPIAFMVLGFLVLTLRGRPTTNNSLGTKVEQATEIGPTIWPVVFAAVAGRSLKITARFCAERGSKLGNLELLMASQTVWGTFESQLLMKRLSIVGAHLFVLWTLSPLGGQASLRLLTTSTAVTNSTAGVRYMPTGGMDWNQTNNGAFALGDNTSGLAAVNSIYSATLLAPESVKDSSQDTWGNVKIPKLEVASRFPSSGDGWTALPVLHSSSDYTSLVGLPVSGGHAQPGSTTLFNIQHSYVSLDCPILYNTSKDEPWWKQQLGYVWSSGNGSTTFYDREKGTQTSFFLDTNTRFLNDRLDALYLNETSDMLANKTLQDTRNVLFGSEYTTPFSNGDYALLLRNCTLGQKYLEAQVQCQASSCRVIAIRPSVRFANRNTHLTPFELMQVSFNTMRNLPLATGTIHNGDAAPSELFIRGASMPFGLASSSMQDMISVSDDAFAVRLGLLLNTYYQLSLAPLAHTGNLPDPTSDVWAFRNVSVSSFEDSSLSAPFIPWNATAVVSKTDEVYDCNYLWLALLLASSSVLLVTGLVGLVLRFKCNAPDMIGFVTSMTYNNPYVTLPPGGGTLGAMERAHLLRDVKVKIGDVKWRDTVGHVAFATLGPGADVRDLDKLKFYA